MANDLPQFLSNLVFPALQMMLLKRLLRLETAGCSVYPSGSEVTLNSGLLSLCGTSEKSKDLILSRRFLMDVDALASARFFSSRLLKRTLEDKNYAFLLTL